MALTTTKASMMRPKVLVVEDSRTQALQTRLGLEAEGFQVVVVADSGSALELARRERPDVVLSDVRMPGTDGFQLCRSFRADGELASTPFVLHSGTFSAEDDRAFALALGAQAFVEKGMEPSPLATVLRDVLEAQAAAADDLDEASFLSWYRKRLLHRLVEEEAALERATAELGRAYDLTLEALVSALDLRDTETRHHSWRVTAYSLRLARGLGLEGDLLVDLERGALLHDIGKIGVPDHILRKPGPLDEDEWSEMRRHPRAGYEMLAGIAFLERPAEIVLTHHERSDGGGYPLGLKGSNVPLASRIFAVADTLDAITSKRPYRDGRSFAVALDEVRRLSGSQFDADVVRVAVSVSPVEWESIKEHVERARERAFARTGGGRAS
jgi:putative nucleotidyltransferase with HDIG domain